MNIRLDIDITGTAAEDLAAIRERMEDRGGMHRAVTTQTLAFVQGPAIAGKQSAANHKSADRLGARHTGHLERAYRGIEPEHDASSARLLVPAASRLRAAFGAYTAKPGAGKTYLTLPVHREAYGRRAGEFDDLFFVRVGPKKTPVLARGGLIVREVLETMYFLTTSVDIPADPDLLPFDEIGDEARDVAELFILTGGTATP